MKVTILALADNFVGFLGNTLSKIPEDTVALTQNALMIRPQRPL